MGSTLAGPRLPPPDAAQVPLRWEGRGLHCSTIPFKREVPDQSPRPASSGAGGPSEA